MTEVKRKDAALHEKRNQRQVGAEYEKKACAFVEAEGMQIVETNYRTRIGEIDMIARDREELVFLEVKYRKDRTYGGADFSISREKQRTIVRVAQVYIRTHRLPARGFYRFDAVLINGEEIRHVRNAWQA